MSRGKYAPGFHQRQPLRSDAGTDIRGLYQEFWQRGSRVAWPDREIQAALYHHRLDDGNGDSIVWLAGSFIVTLPMQANASSPGRSFHGNPAIAKDDYPDHIRRPATLVGHCT